MANNFSTAQPAGQPEICKMSQKECSVKGGDDLFIIGKNFAKGSTVIFQEIENEQVIWSEKALIDTEYFHAVSFYMI